ncbi:MAG: tetratricopeptide repeat protein [Gemmatimonadales bacterium]
MAGSFAEAESLFTETLEMRRRWLGVDAPETLGALNSIAMMRWRRNDLAGAEEAVREAMRLGSRRGLADSNPYTLNSMHVLGVILRDQGHYEQSELQLRRALAGRRMVLGPNQAPVAATLRQLGVLLHRTGRDAEAEQLLRQALQIYRLRQPARNLNIAGVESELAGVITARKRPSEAEPLLRDALSIQSEQLKPSDPRLAETRRVLGVTLAALGNQAEAETLLLASYRVAKDHPFGVGERQATLRSLIAFYVERRRADEADAYRRLLSAR